MEQEVRIFQTPSQDGVNIHVGAHIFTITGTQWVTMKANNDFNLSSPNVSHALTKDEIAEINKRL